MGRVFISHAKIDEALIDSFVDLLHTGLNLSRVYSPDTFRKMRDV